MVLFATPETPPLALANCWPARFGQSIGQQAALWPSPGLLHACAWDYLLLTTPSFMRNRLPHTVRWSTRPVLTLLDTVALHPGQCQATVLWDPEGDVPSNVRGDVRHFAWLHPPPVPTALVGRNRWWCLLPRKPPRLHWPTVGQPDLGSL